MSDLNRLADLLLPGIRNAQLKLEEVSNYLSAMPNSLRHYDGWQLIETAPKDEWILTYQANGERDGIVFTGGHCYVAKWAYGNQFWYDKSSNILDIPDTKNHVATYFTCVPSHLMPLPEPPTLKEGE